MIEKKLIQFKSNTIIVKINNSSIWSIIAKQYDRKKENINIFH